MKTEKNKIFICEKFYQMNMEDKDFSNADLKWADFKYSKLASANFEKANLIGADLTGADLSGANLAGANLAGADLSGANLAGANLKDADLEDADLEDANLEDADLSNANLTRSFLKKTNFTNSLMNDVCLTEAIISKETIFHGTIIELIIKKYQPYSLSFLQKIANIILGNPSSLESSSWHSECKTTHCLAGWAIVLHPEGQKLAENFGNEIAGFILLGRQAHSYFYSTNEEILSFLKKIVK